MANKLDTDLVCTTCRWRAGHSPDCPRKDEPWPTIEVPEAADEITRLNALVDEMREGLEPFAKIAGEFDVPVHKKLETPPPDNMMVCGESYLNRCFTVGDFRRARALITKASRDSGHETRT